jgi:hypothetical protein
MFDKHSYTAGYMRISAEAASYRPSGTMKKVAVGPAAPVIGVPYAAGKVTGWGVDAAQGAAHLGWDVAKWTADKLIGMATIIALLPPALGGVAGIAASRMTSPTQLDEKSLQALVEQQELDRALAETGRLSAVRKGKLKRQQEKSNERSLYLG